MTSRKSTRNIFENLADLFFFQIVIIADLEYKGKIYKNVKQKNNDSILTPENWEQHKETFFTQRMETYKESYTLEEKIKLELSALENLTINQTDYQILKDRYKLYLEEKQALPLQKEALIFKFENNFDNVDEQEVYHHFKSGLVKKKLITEEDFQKFLIAAFQNKTAPIKKFNLKNIDSKDKVMKVFYLYYKDKAGKPYGKQKSYAGLLGDYFFGYKTSNVSSNFSKSVY